MSKASSGATLGGSIAALVILAACCGGVSFVKNNWNEHVSECTIKRVDRVSTGSKGSSDMRIYTEQCGVLGNSDALFEGKFDSADIYGALEPGHTYKLRIAGWRVPFLSAFPNILEIEGEVNK